MVKVTNSCKRFAFTMIELIFAIVIIAISVMSLPMMSQVTQQGIEDSIVQEAIFAASGKLMDATTGYWDENSMQDANLSDYSRVINNIPGGLNDCNNTTKLRPGHINQPFHRRCLDDNTTTPADGNITFGNNVFDLNDASETNLNIFTNLATDETGYKKNYISNVTVTRNGYVKTVTATITQNGSPVVVLTILSANIGEPEYYMRTF